jgi:hypothetical protein
MVAAASNVRGEYKPGTGSLVPPFQQGFRQDRIHGKPSIGAFSLSDFAIRSTFLHRHHAGGKIQTDPI